MTKPYNWCFKLNNVPFTLLGCNRPPWFPQIIITSAPGILYHFLLALLRVSLLIT